MPVPGYRKPGYHKLFELLNDAVIVTDADRRILYINPAVQALRCQLPQRRYARGGANSASAPMVPGR